MLGYMASLICLYCNSSPLLCFGWLGLLIFYSRLSVQKVICVLSLVSGVIVELIAAEQCA